MSLKSKTSNLEKSLQRIVSKLNTHVSQSDLKNIWQNSNSLGRIKTTVEYERDRIKTIQSLKQINDPRLLTIQSEVLLKELDNCLQSEYTTESLPLLLHQFYFTRVEQMVQLKHMLMCRWERFAINDTPTYATLTEEYQKCIKRITDEYSYCLGRARHLSVVEDLYSSQKPIPYSLINNEDVYIYLKWLVHSFQTMKKIMTFVTEIQLLPLHNQEQPNAPVFASRSNSRNQIKWRSVGNRMRRLSRSLTSGSNSSSISIGLSDSEFHNTNLDAGSIATEPLEEDDTPPVTSLPTFCFNVKDMYVQLQRLMASYPSLLSSDYSMASSSDQLKIFYLIYGEFKSVFQQQVEMSTFQVYDSPSNNSDDDSGTQSSNMAFLKSTNWLESIEIRPIPDVLQVKCYIEMSDFIMDIDPILSLCSSCIETDNQEKVLFALKQHYQAIYSDQPVKHTPTAVANNKEGQDPMLLWRCIYKAVDMRNPRNKKDSRAKFSLNDEETDMLDDIRGSTSMQDARQLLYEEEGRNISASAQTMPQNATFGFLLLRHIKIREQKIKCLWLINYMCSVERTITINTNGLSQKQGSLRNNLGINMHLFTTPADYIINKDEFMQYSEVENHDDYYSFSDSVIRVWDQLGKPIMYTTAQDRMKKVEKQLLTVASYYIQKDILTVNERNESDENIDIDILSQNTTDRFAILLDLWNVHFKFLEAKIQLINLYLEAYHSVYDKTEKSKLAQIIVDLIGRSVRFDPSAQYFTKAYESETNCLKAQFDAVQSILKYLLQSERDYNIANCSTDVRSSSISSHSTITDPESSTTHISGTKYNTKQFGLPPPFCKSKLISLSGDLRTEVNHHLFECFNSLSAISLLSPLVQHSLQMAIGLDNVTEVEAIVALNTKLWCKINECWTRTKPLGFGFNEETQNMIFSTNAICQPSTMVTVTQQYMKAVTNMKNNPNTDEGRLKAFCNVLQMVTSHYQLILACHRSTVLHAIYRNQIAFLEEEDSNGYLQPVKLEAAFLLSSEVADLDNSIHEARKATLISKPSQDPTLPLAIQELFINCIDKFSFDSKDDILKILMFPDKMNSVLLTLQAQVAYQNSLLVTCQQCAMIIRFTAPLHKNRKFGDFSNVATAAIQNSEHISLLYLYQNSFLSLQKEKTGVRNYVLSKYKSAGTSAVSGMIDSYCKNLMKSLSVYSLRHQITVVYLRLHSLLVKYPSTRNAFFTIGKPKFNNSTTFVYDTLSNEDMRSIKSLMSSDSKFVLNLFYLPHNSEIVVMFTHLSIEEQFVALKHVLDVASALYNIVSYMCAVAEIGSMCGNHLQAKGTENIGGELQNLKEKFLKFQPPQANEVIKFLNSFYRSLILSHDLVIRYLLKQTLLLNNNQESSLIIDSISIAGLNKLTTNGFDHSLSHPLLSTNKNVYHDTSVLPWRQFLARYGSCLISAGALMDVFSIVYVTVASLTISGRHVASGELLALTLSLEDLVMANEADLLRKPNNGNTAAADKQQDTATCTLPSVGAASTMIHHPIFDLSSLPLVEDNKKKRHSLLTCPILQYELINKFLVLHLQVEKLRHVWACTVMNVSSVRTYREAKHFHTVFKQKVVKLAKKAGIRHDGDGQRYHIPDDHSTNDVGSIGSTTEMSIQDSCDPSGGNINEMSLYQAQLSVLEELLDQQLLEAEIKYVEKLSHLSVQEMQRDPDSLPLDLWKKESMKDVLDVSAPQFVKDFVSSIIPHRHQAGHYQIPEKMLLRSINDLSSAVLRREKDCYHLYASSYETTIQSLYHQLYVRNQEIENYRKKIKSLSSRNRKDMMISSSDMIYGLLLEITGLRTKVSQLNKQLKEQEAAVRKSVIKEYDRLLEELADSSIATKAKYETYRNNLYSDTLASLEKTRQNVAANLLVLKEKISSNATHIDEDKLEDMKGVKQGTIQRENTRLSNMVSLMKSFHEWRKIQQSTEKSNMEMGLKTELDNTQIDYLQLKIRTDQEINSLKQQVLELQRNLAFEEMTCSQLQKSLKIEKRKKMATQQETLKDKDKPTAVERFQQEKIEKLVTEIDQKDHQLKSLMASQEEEMKYVNYERKKMSKSWKQMRQTLHHERHVKLDAFHQIDDLISQVHDLEHMSTPMDGRSVTNTPGLFSLARSIGTTTPSSIRSASHISASTKPPSQPPDHRSSTPSFKLTRPKMDDGRGTARTTTPSEISSIVNPPQGMGGAFKLI